MVVGQCISGDCENGTGIYLYANGDKYAGEWKDGKRHGQGIITWGNNKQKIYLSKLNNAPAFIYGAGFGDFPEYSNLKILNCSKYEGEFRDNQQDGYGVLTFEEGMTWTGLFNEDRLSMGCISGDCEDDYGVYLMLWTDLYVGKFKDGQRHGKGTYTWGPVSEKYYSPDMKHLASVGSQYVGDWENNRRNGIGVQTSNDGSRYEGEYRNHQKNGKGIYVSAELDYEGIGALLSSNIDSNYVVITKVYRGFPSEKAGLIEGDKILEVNGKNAKDKTTQELISILKGTTNSEINILIERNGNNLTFRFNREKVKLPSYTYTGEFKDDKRHGQGIYISRFGEKYQGLFEENKFISGECWDEDENKIECP